MKASEKEILSLRAQDNQRAKKTKNNFLIGMGIIVLGLIILSFSLYQFDISWKDIKDYPLLGIPLGVCIWSFIGSFAAMLLQFQKEPIEKFGDPLKWVIIRPVLGVVMGAAIYLALFSLVLTGNNQNALLPLLVAFFVGYSDTFTYDIMTSIQNIISSLFSSANHDDIKGNTQPIYMVAPPTTEPVAVVPNSDNTTIYTTPAEVDHKDVLADQKAEEEAKIKTHKKIEEDKDKDLNPGEDE